MEKEVREPQEDEGQETTINIINRSVFHMAHPLPLQAHYRIIYPYFNLEKCYLIQGIFKYIQEITVPKILNVYKRG